MRKRTDKDEADDTAEEENNGVNSTDERSQWGQHRRAPAVAVPPLSRSGGEMRAWIGNFAGSAD